MLRECEFSVRQMTQRGRLQQEQDRQRVGSQGQRAGIEHTGTARVRVGRVTTAAYQLRISCAQSQPAASLEHSQVVAQHTGSTELEADCCSVRWQRAKPKD